jgi:hypothetical protein
MFTNAPAWFKDYMISGLIGILSLVGTTAWFLSELQTTMELGFHQMRLSMVTLEEHLEDDINDLRSRIERLESNKQQQR